MGETHQPACLLADGMKRASVANLSPRSGGSEVQHLAESGRPRNWRCHKHTLAMEIEKRELACPVSTLSLGRLTQEVPRLSHACDSTAESQPAHRECNRRGAVQCDLKSQRHPAAFQPGLGPSVPQRRDCSAKSPQCHPNLDPLFPRPQSTTRRFIPRRS